MAASARFRSIRAFKDYEQRSSPEVSPLRVMAALKDTGEGLRKIEIARHLGADVESVDAAVLYLLKEKMVTIQRGESAEEDLIVP